MKKNQIPVAGV